MGLKLNGSSSGSVELNAPASTTSGADVVLTLPVNDGDANQFLQTNGSGTLTWATETTSNLTRVSAVDTSSGDGDSTNTAVVFDSIPSNARRIVVSFWNVSGDASSNHLLIVLRTGSGTDVTSGYYAVANAISGASGSVLNRTNSLPVWLNVAAERNSGIATLTNIEGDKWVFSAHGAFYSNYVHVAGGYVDLGATLTGVKVYLGNGNDFDSGRIGLTYEV